MPSIASKRADRRKRLLETIAAEGAAYPSYVPDPKRPDRGDVRAEKKMLASQGIPVEPLLAGKQESHYAKAYGMKTLVRPRSAQMSSISVLPGTSGTSGSSSTVLPETSATSGTSGSSSTVLPETSATTSGSSSTVLPETSATSGTSGSSSAVLPMTQSTPLASSTTVLPGALGTSQWRPVPPWRTAQASPPHHQVSPAFCKSFRLPWP